MKLANARICVECEEIYDLIRTLIVGTGNVRVCPSCTSTSTVPLARWLKTMAEYECEEVLRNAQEGKEVCSG